MGLPKSGSSSGAGYRWCSKDKMLHKDPQATQLPRPFSKVMRQQACVSQESWADPEALHVEKPAACGAHYREGVGSLSIRVEQVSRGFLHQQ
eukprot:8256409-Ditylum_brightwellii.AAC.2